MNYQFLLFDLDGTLVDSRADITDSVNYTLAELAYPTLPDETIRHFIGEGVQLLLQRSLHAALTHEPTAAQLQTALQLYRRLYHEHLLDKTILYPGVGETLQQLAHLSKAIVTNKPYDFTVKLLAGIGLAEYFPVVLGGDSLPERKPHPLMLQTALEQLGGTAQQALMIGDSWVDIEAGQRAGIATCGYTKGFRGAQELQAAKADYLLAEFTELTAIVLG